MKPTTMSRVCNRLLAARFKPAFNHRTATTSLLASKQLVPSLAAASSFHSHSSFNFHSSSTLAAASKNDNTSTSSDLRTGQVHITLPQLAPRMMHGRVIEWNVKEGESIQPRQLIMTLETHELTEDGSRYLMQIESDESGTLKKILVNAPSDALDVGTPLAVFEDETWTEADGPRGQFVTQAYVKEGTLRTGECIPRRTDVDHDTEEEESSNKASRRKTAKANRK